jgi:hypothetical protein
MHADPSRPRSRRPHPQGGVLGTLRSLLAGSPLLSASGSGPSALRTADQLYEVGACGRSAGGGHDPRPGGQRDVLGFFKTSFLIPL